MPDTETKKTEVETSAPENAAEAAEDSKENMKAEEAAAETKAEEKTEEAAAEEETEKDSEEEKAPEEEKPGREEKEKKFFGRKKEKKDKKDEKIEELTDKLTRQMAEFDNYRKRTDKEKAANYMIGAKDVIEKLLPVLDNFERGLAGADLSDPFADGVNKIYKQLLTILTDIGVTPIEAVGKEFDPNFHNAVMHVEDENLGENIVAEEFQKGYLYKEQVVRHSMVKVAN